MNDAILLFVGLFAVGLAVAAAAQRTAALPVAIASLSALLGILATILVAVRLIWPPGGGATTLDYGAWLGLAACLGIVLGAYRSMADERTPRTVAPKIDVTPLPPPSPEGNGA